MTSKTKKPPVPRDSWAYRGYLIRKYRTQDGYWIEKGGHVILRFTPSPAAAQREIDTLLD